MQEGTYGERGEAEDRGGNEKGDKEKGARAGGGLLLPRWCWGGKARSKVEEEYINLQKCIRYLPTGDITQGKILLLKGSLRVLFKVDFRNELVRFFLKGSHRKREIALTQWTLTRWTLTRWPTDLITNNVRFHRLIFKMFIFFISFFF